MRNPEASISLAAQRSRVILCATCYPDADAAMTLATELARQIGAELHGVLVRDRAAFCAAGGIVTAVVSYSGARTTNVTKEDLLNAFRADSRRFQDQLQRRARGAMLRAAFRETEGQLIETMETAAKPGDVIIFGFRPLLRGGDDLVIVTGESDTPPEFAEDLARKLNKNLVMLQSGGRQNDLLIKLNRMSPAAVILTGAQPGLPSLTRIVEAARCPVIVSRGPRN